MHYIIGTSFRIASNNKTVFDRRLFAGKTYTLYSMVKKDDKMIYTFIDESYVRTALEFNSCRDADLYISKLRNEQLPNTVLTTTLQPDLNID